MTIFELFSCLKLFNYCQYIQIELINAKMYGATKNNIYYLFHLLSLTQNKL